MGLERRPTCERGEGRQGLAGRWARVGVAHVEEALHEGVEEQLARHRGGVKGGDHLNEGEERGGRVRARVRVRCEASVR